MRRGDRRWSRVARGATWVLGIGLVLGAGMRVAGGTEVGGEASLQDSQALELGHYRLEVTIDTAAPALAGTVTITGRAAGADVAGLTLDLASSMAVEGARVSVAGGAPSDAAFEHAGDRVEIDFPVLPRRGDIVSVAVDFGGLPEGRGFTFGGHEGGFSAASYGLPYTARQWWPSLDLPTAKADSADVLITVPEPLTAVSVGTLVARTENGDGTATHHWRTRYPVYPDVIGVTASRYATFQLTYEALDGSEMPVRFWVFPQDLDKARTDFSVLPDILAHHARRFGEYPFVEEKYGVAEFHVNSFREHHTVPVYGPGLITGDHRNDWILAHEAAHQWFGNLVSVADWSQVWLNESFSTYAAALWFEESQGVEAYRQFLRARDRGAFEGAPVLDDSLDTSRMFTGTTFVKGAWVLHMLRGIMGDDAFFRGLRDYLETHAYANARTADFQLAMEDAHGEELDWFFRQWVRGEGRPAYEASWTMEGDEAVVTLRQTGDRVFRMPVPLRLTMERGDTTVVADNTLRAEIFRFGVDEEVTAVSIDPEGWILKQFDDEEGGSG